MDEIPAQQALIPLTDAQIRSSTQCSAGLWKLLSEGDDGRSAVRLIAINRTLRAECEARLPALAQAAAGAEREEIAALLVSQAPVYGVTARSDQEWQSYWGAYLDALEGIPLAAIEEAFVRWNRGEGAEQQGKHAMMREFYPKPAQLLALSVEPRAKLKMAAYRAKRALEYVEEHRPPISEDERRKNREALRSLAASLTAREIPGAPARPRMSPQQMAAQIRGMAQPKDDTGHVL